MIDPATRLVVAFATGVRNEQLIGSSESVLQVLQDTVSHQDRTRTASLDP